MNFLKVLFTVILSSVFSVSTQASECRVTSMVSSSGGFGGGGAWGGEKIPFDEITPGIYTTGDLSLVISKVNTNVLVVGYWRGFSKTYSQSLEKTEPMTLQFSDENTSLQVTLDCR